MATDRPLRASVTVDAQPEQVWQLVTDITRMGEWSPQCTGGRWLGAAAPATVGARFVGFNRSGLLRWATLNAVVAAEPGRLFTFRTFGNGARWSYRIEPNGTGADVVHTRELPAGGRGAFMTSLTRLFFGGTEQFDAELEVGMQQTLDRIKAAVEA